MEPIYVTGHRNPDTDSIVAAMAYAELRKALGDREYEAACLGPLPDETKRVLDRFGLCPPKRIFDVYTQVKDLAYDTPPVLSSAVTVGRAWTILQGLPNVPALAVAGEDGALHGILSREDVASYHMGLVSSSYLRPVPVYSLLSVLEGKLLDGSGANAEMISGEVSIALANTPENLLFKKKDTIVICGNNPDIIKRALDIQVNCLILCQPEITEDLRKINTPTNIIITPYDVYRTVRLIFQSAPVGRICKTKDLTVFHLDDRLDEVKELVLKKKAHCYPILNAEEKVMGILSRQHLLRPHRKKVVLVDHNEKAQSVPGLDQAEILEIIDHHRLADIQTANPVFVRNEPVGSTNTIIAEMFQERGLMPSASMAGIMAAAIVSDTVMFKSPTCTQRDCCMAERMARIANISLDELGRDMFSVSLNNKDTRELLFTDYKEFHIAGHNLAVSQITCVDSPSILSQRKMFLEEMCEIQRKKNFDMVILMLTDVLLEGSHLIYVGDDEIIRQAFSVIPRENTAFLPGVVSRKKQVIPSLSDIWG